MYQYMEKQLNAVLEGVSTTKKMALKILHDPVPLNLTGYYESTIVKTLCELVFKILS